MDYDVIIIGAGPGGIYSAYELKQKRSDLKVAVFEAGCELAKRHCPIDGDKIIMPLSGSEVVVRKK